MSKILICALSIGMITSCEKKSKDFSIIPELKWSDYEFEIVGDPADNRRNLILKTDFTDLDGDIGLRPQDIPTDSCNFSAYNFFIRYFEKVQGEYKEILPADPCLPFHVVLPYLTPLGQNKVLEGEINLAFSYLAFPKNSNVDSVRFEFQLKDRAGHLSNIAYSPSIYVEP